jgi:hypothetical protein
MPISRSTVKHEAAMYKNTLVAIDLMAFVSQNAQGGCHEGKRSRVP